MASIQKENQMTKSYNTLLTEIDDQGVALITLNRPKALNALCDELMRELDEITSAYEQDPNVRVMVLTGSEKAFAAGADIKEMAGKNYADAYQENFIRGNWTFIAKCRKPIIAMVSGYALGGGCEIAMMCDFIIASDTAQFGQPEITIGTIPGAGGSQRLTRFVGKSKAMEMCLTGRMMGAEEAERSGLVAHIFPQDSVKEETFKIAHKIASYSQIAAKLTKECVNTAYETTLEEGLHFEVRNFHATFATKDQKEGMSAFVEKRKPNFTDQ